MISENIKNFYNNKKIIITGGTGLIGRFIVKKLCDFGAKVTIVSLDKFNNEKRANHIIGNLTNFDNFTLHDLFKYQFIRGIKTVLPLNYIQYDDQEVRKILEQKFGWVNYGGHHYESLLTKFVVSYYLPVKFGIDRRRTSLSAMVRSKKISRDKAIEILFQRPMLNDQEDLKNYILDKIDLSNKEFEEVMKAKAKNYKNYKTYLSYFKNFSYLGYLAYKLNFIPKILFLRYFGSK